MTHGSRINTGSVAGVQVMIRLFAGLRERAGSALDGGRPPDGLDGGATSGRRSASASPSRPGSCTPSTARTSSAAHPLSEGDEVALIPPVSGGAFRLSEEPLSLDDVVREVASDDAGAIATFVGTTRARSRGRDVVRLEYEAYEGMAEETMAAIAAELRERYELTEIAIHHRIGVVEIGDSIRRDRGVRAPSGRRARRRAGMRSTRSRTGSRSGRRRSTRAARSGSVRARDVTDLDDPYAARTLPDGEHDPQPVKHPHTARSLLAKLAAPIVVALGLIVKFSAFAIKFFGIFISVAAYALIWGFSFAIGFVLLILVHELGHYLEARRQGLHPSLPVFVPFLGAYVAIKDSPFNPWRNGLVSIAGPIAGGAAAAGVLVAGEILDSGLLLALAYTGFFLNLFNLRPDLDPRRRLHLALLEAAPARCRRSHAGRGETARLDPRHRLRRGGTASDRRDDLRARAAGPAVTEVSTGGCSNARTRRSRPTSR